MDWNFLKYAYLGTLFGFLNNNTLHFCSNFPLKNSKDFTKMNEVSPTHCEGDNSYYLIIKRLGKQHRIVKQFDRSLVVHLMVWRNWRMKLLRCYRKYAAQLIPALRCIGGSPLKWVFGRAEWGVLLICDENRIEMTKYLEVSDITGTLEGHFKTTSIY